MPNPIRLPPLALRRHAILFPLSLANRGRGQLSRPLGRPSGLLLGLLLDPILFPCVKIAVG